MSASAGRPTANASVAPARYGPRSRLAAAPTGIPTAAVTTADATSAGISAQPSLPISSATVYAPTAISAPWPSEIWPLQPGEHRQPGERGEVVGAGRELQVVVGADVGR